MHIQVHRREGPCNQCSSAKTLFGCPSTGMYRLAGKNMHTHTCTYITCRYTSNMRVRICTCLETCIHKVLPVNTHSVQHEGTSYVYAHVIMRNSMSLYRVCVGVKPMHSPCFLYYWKDLEDIQQPHGNTHTLAGGWQPANWISSGRPDPTTWSLRWRLTAFALREQVAGSTARDSGRRQKS